MTVSKSVKSRLLLQAQRLNQPVRRYSIQSDGDHDYFVEIGMEGEFERWMESFEDPDIEYVGNDYENNRIDGRFTFTDPRCD